MDIVKWTIETLVDACSACPTHGVKLEIPKFQRRREWKRYQEEELINTMHNNISIGVLQVYYLEKQSDCDVYLLIDGLHRVSTLVNYYNDVFGYESTKNIIEEIIDETVIMCDESIDEEDVKIRSICKQWFCEKQLISYNDLLSKNYKSKKDELIEIIKKYVSKSNCDDVYTIIMKMTKKFTKKIGLKKSIIPVIINTCDIKNIPLLFSKINQGGTPLSNTDILAATWYNDERITINNTKITDNVKSHYNEMKKENNEMELFDDINHDNNTYNIYEYLIGLHSALLNTYENTFYSLIKNKELIFKIVSCCFYADISKQSIEKIKDKIKILDLDEFERKILWAIKFISETFDSIVILTNGSKVKLIVRESQFYIALIGLCFRNEIEILNDVDKYKNLFRMHLLHDKVSETSFNAKSISLIVEDRSYMFSINEKEFNQKIDKFIYESIRTTGKRDRVSNVSLLILSILHSRECEDLDNVKSYDSCNIILKKHIDDYNKTHGIMEQISINSLGNLVIYQINKKKKGLNETIIDYMKNMNMTTSEIDEYIICDDDLIYNQDDDEIDKKIYNNFLKSRCDMIKNEIIDKYKECFKNKKKVEEEKEQLDSNIREKTTEKPQIIKLNKKKQK